MVTRRPPLSSGCEYISSQSFACTTFLYSLDRSDTNRHDSSPPIPIHCWCTVPADICRIYLSDNIFVLWSHSSRISVSIALIECLNWLISSCTSSFISWWFSFDRMPANSLFSYRAKLGIPYPGRWASFQPLPAFLIQKSEDISWAGTIILTYNYLGCQNQLKIWPIFLNGRSKCWKFSQIKLVMISSRYVSIFISSAL